MTPNFFLTKSSRIAVKLPFFIPVYRPDYSFRLFDQEHFQYGLNAIMVNAFLLFRHRELRTRFENGYTLREHLGGFPGMLCTDSGAFQQLSGRKVELDAQEIVKFQNTIQADVIAPLDLITPPETAYEETLQRMIVSHHRIEEALPQCDYADLSAIQQGGGFYSLRQKHIRDLAAIGFRYYGIGSMVPFFNKNHDLHFTCSVIKDAREVIGPNTAMHVYGAGDPLDMAFMYHAGANVFDSSSYAHYAKGGFYMTPYGAVCKPNECEMLDYRCECPVCRTNSMTKMFHKTEGEILRREHNLFVLLETVRVLGERTRENRLDEYLAEVHDRHLKHVHLFPNSKLGSSWEKYLRGESCERIKERSNLIPETHFQEEESTFTQAEETLLEFLAEESVQTYKMDREKILAHLRTELSSPKNAGFRGRIEKTQTLKAVLKLAECKAFRKKTRSYFYQNLRKYKTSDYDLEALLARFIESDGEETPILLQQLLDSHVSTRERLPFQKEHVELLRRLFPENGTVIDIGCGYHPLMLPPECYTNLKRYVAVDKDADSVEAVRVYARKFGIENLKAYTWDLSTGIAALEQLTGVQRYDFAMVLKVIPVLVRAEKMRREKTEEAGIPVLGEFPVTTMLASVSRESMTKRESIEKRELAVLRQFMKTYDYREESEFSCGTEFGYCMSRKM